MRAVNLLPRDLERPRSEAGRAPLLVAGGGFAAVTAAAVVLFMSASGSASDQRSQLDSVEASIAQVPAAGQPAVASGAIAQERTDRVAALAAALSTRVPSTGSSASSRTCSRRTRGSPASPPRRRRTPRDLSRRGPGAASTAAQGVTIQGATYSHHSVARVLARLRRSRR